MHNFFNFAIFIQNKPRDSGWFRRGLKEKQWNYLRVCGFAGGVRIPINSDTCSNPFRTVFRDIRTVVGAKRRSALTY
jgi:hypothetical protein